jgi:hypothetical protein
MLRYCMGLIFISDQKAKIVSAKFNQEYKRWVNQNPSKHKSNNGQRVKAIGPSRNRVGKQGHGQDGPLQ